MADKKWYVVHTYSGYENKAKLGLIENIKRMGLEEHFGEVMIPTEEVVDTTKKTKRTISRKYFPSYILVEMEMTQEAWHCVKSVPKITGFVGNATKPPPVPEREINALRNQIETGGMKPKPTISFEEGESVRVNAGPFAGFSGTVEEVRPDKGRVVVSVSIFGRATPIELDYSQVEKE